MIERQNNLNVPLVFFEGANAEQMLRRNYMEFLEACSRLITLGYVLFVFTNHGLPYCFAGSSIDCINSCFDGLSLSYQYQSAPCHYFDLLAYKADLRVNLPEMILSSYSNTRLYQ
jgi:hypothetical protein